MSKVAHGGGLSLEWHGIFPVNRAEQSTGDGDSAGG